MRDPDGHTSHNRNYDHTVGKRFELKKNLQTIMNIPNILIIYQRNSSIEIGIKNIEFMLVQIPRIQMKSFHEKVVGKIG